MKEASLICDADDPGDASQVGIVFMILEIEPDFTQSPIIRRRRLKISFNDAMPRQVLYFEIGDFGGPLEDGEW